MVRGLFVATQEAERHSVKAAASFHPESTNSERRALRGRFRLRAHKGSGRVSRRDSPETSATPAITVNNVQPGRLYRPESEDSRLREDSLSHH